MAEKLAHDLEWIADRSVRLYLRTVAATGWRVLRQSLAGARTTRRLIVVLAGLVLVAGVCAGSVVLYRHLRTDRAGRPLLVGVDDDTLKWTP